MEIHKKNFPKNIKDNDEIFLSHIEGILSSTDELCSVEITNLPEYIKFRIAPSHPKYTNHIIEGLINFHNMFKIRMDMSKSITTTAVITFNIKKE